MDNTPTNYEDICKEALDVKNNLGLTDIQTLLYNHVCRGDFYLRNGDGQLFYDKDNNGFGWSSSRDWVKKQFGPLVKKGMVKFQSLRDCRCKNYTSWVWFSPNYDYDDLVEASCFVTTWKLALIKHYLELPDGFSKTGKYGDIEFIKDDQAYTFKYKGESSIYAWDNNGKGEKQDLTWMNGKSTFDFAIHYKCFSDMVHDIWSFMSHDGYKGLMDIPKYTTKRILK